MADIYGTPDPDGLNGTADDDLIVGDGGDDLINANGGNDIVQAGTGADTVNGGDGDDDIYGDSGNDTLNGDAGDDEIFGEADNDIITGGSGHDYLIGGDGDDTISGDDGDDYLDGGAGNDILIGGSGTDYLEGNDGDDAVTYRGLGYAFGGTGSDQLTIDLSNMAGPTDLNLLAAFGVIFPQPPEAVAGFEVLAGYTGSAFADRLTLAYGYAGATQINSGAGDDAVVGGLGADTIQLGDGNDSASGNEGDDIIHGGAGNDELDGEAGADQLFGGDGNDTLTLFEPYHGPGDTFDGGAGFDTLWVSLEGAGLTFAGITHTGIERLVATSSSYPLQISAAQLGPFSAAEGHFQITGAGAVTLSTVFGGTITTYTSITLDQAITAFTFASASGTEVSVTAGDNGMALTGGAGNDGLVGGLGSDVLSGGLGNDLLAGGAGLDRLYGGDGDDLIQYTFVADGPAGLNDTISGGAGLDTLTLTSEIGADATLSLLSISGIENLSSSGVRITAAELAQFDEVSGSIRIIGTGTVAVTSVHFRIANITFDDTITVLDLSGATYDAENYTYITGGDGNNTIIGGNGQLNSIEGGGGNDVLYGGTSYDSLSGGAGDDALFGGGSADQLYGGAGRDELHGGDGDDGLEVGLVTDLVAGEIYDGGAGIDTLFLRDIFAEQPGIYNLTGATLISIEGLYSSPYGTLLTAAQMQSAQYLSGKFILANNAAVALAGFDHSALEVQLAGGGQVFSLNGSNGFYPDGEATVYGGTGHDTITGGGNFRSDLYGGDGNDVLIEGDGGYIQTLYGDAGNDRLILTNGATAIGGAGYDTVQLNGAVWTNGIIEVEAIELTAGSSLRLNVLDYRAMDQSLQTVTGNGTITVDLQVDVVNGFLVSLNFNGGGIAFSGAVNFVINGTGLSDTIKINPATAATVLGGDGNDQIRGGLLADTINGGDNNDKLIGYGGADILTGGAGADQFRYLFASDSGTGANADQITDFLSGTDRLNFALLDADPVAAGRQALSFIDTAAFSATGTAQVRYAASGADLLVQVDLDGDGNADMEIVLQSANGQVLNSNDFML